MSDYNALDQRTGGAHDPVIVDRYVRLGRTLRAAYFHDALVSLGRTLWRLVHAPLAGLRRERRRREAHEELLRLDDHLLSDVGLTRLDVFRYTGRLPESAEDPLARRLSLSLTDHRDRR